jgi:hypothetical protein
MSTIRKHPSLLIGTVLSVLLAASSSPAATIGQTRCLILDQQLSGVTRAVETTTPLTVSALAEKARGLCSKGKTAQGLRAYAKALTLAGSQPALP